MESEKSENKLQDIFQKISISVLILKKLCIVLYNLYKNEIKCLLFLHPASFFPQKKPFSVGQSRPSDQTGAQIAKEKTKSKFIYYFFYENSIWAGAHGGKEKVHFCVLHSFRNLPSTSVPSSWPHHITLDITDDFNNWAFSVSEGRRNTTKQNGSNDTITCVLCCCCCDMRKEIKKIPTFHLAQKILSFFALWPSTSSVGENRNLNYANKKHFSRAALLCWREMFTEKHHINKDMVNFHIKNFPPQSNDFHIFHRASHNQPFECRCTAYQQKKVFFEFLTTQTAQRRLNN